MLSVAEAEAVMLPLCLTIDTNALISAALNPAGLQLTALRLAVTKPARLCVSRPILEEYELVLARPGLRIRKVGGSNCCNSSRTVAMP
jgi:hypothetical protein